ncbi:MAG TPA: ATP-binding protein [Candidatus Binatia bacterium]|nr:ATP-binding protein [Candidatus Binatia bacterium]
MEAVIFCGIQASGKTTFYRERFFDTHVRISLDLVRTRRREDLLIAACLAGRQPFVVDNTNATVADRARYIEPARSAGFAVVGYYFATDPRAAFDRNRKRPGRAAIPAAGLFGTHKRLQPPTLEEGFRTLYRVEIAEGAGFRVTPVEPAESPPAR